MQDYQAANRSLVVQTWQANLLCLISDEEGIDRKIEYIRVGRDGFDVEDPRRGTRRAG